MNILDVSFLPILGEHQHSNTICKCPLLSGITSLQMLILGISHTPLGLGTCWALLTPVHWVKEVCNLLVVLACHSRNGTDLCGSDFCGSSPSSFSFPRCVECSERACSRYRDRNFHEIIGSDVAYRQTRRSPLEFPHILKSSGISKDEAYLTNTTPGITIAYLQLYLCYENPFRKMFHVLF